MLQKMFEELIYLCHPLEILFRWLLVPVLVPHQPRDEELLVRREGGYILQPVLLHQLLREEPRDHFVLQTFQLHVGNRAITISLQR